MYYINLICSRITNRMENFPRRCMSTKSSSYENIIPTKKWRRVCYITKLWTERRHRQQRMKLTREQYLERCILHMLNWTTHRHGINHGTVSFVHVINTLLSEQIYEIGFFSLLNSFDTFMQCILQCISTRWNVW